MLLLLSFLAVDYENSGQYEMGIDALRRSRDLCLSAARRSDCAASEALAQNAFQTGNIMSKLGQYGDIYYQTLMRFEALGASCGQQVASFLISCGVACMNLDDDSEAMFVF